MIEKKGGEVIVNEATRNTVPVVVRLEDGRLVVVFDTPNDGDERDIYGRFLDDEGPTGAVFKINTTTAGEQGLPAVAAIEGGFVVTWVDRGIDGRDWQIRGQRYDVDGDKVGAEFTVTTAVGNQTTPSVTALEGGGFVVVWHDKSYERTYRDFDLIKAQVFNAAGAKVGGEIALSPTPSGLFFYAQAEPDVVALADGGFVMSWTEQGADGDVYDTGVRAQVFNADGSARSGRIIVNTATAGFQGTSATAVLADGRIMVVYSELVSPFEPLKLKGQLLSATGQELGGEITFDHDTETPFSPEIVALANGNYVLVWEGGTAVGVFVREFQPDGTAVGETIRVNSNNGGTYLYSHVAATEDGFVVVWGTSGPGGGDTVRAQYFTSSGGPVDPGDTPSEGDDDLEGDGGPNVIDGLGGNDEIRGEGGDDDLKGGSGSDKLYGGDGNDDLDGGTGVDDMTGGAGDDDYVVDNVADRAIEKNGEGYDTVRSSVTFSLAGSYVEQLILTGLNDTDATGNSLDNSLIGNTGNNILDGGRGGDRMTGGLGDDTYIVDQAGDIVIEAKDGGHDTVRASIDYDLAGRYIEDLELLDGAANGSGNSLVNRITGSIANNVLDGRGGADTLIGGLGNDRYIVDNEGDRAIELVGQGTDTVFASVNFSLAGQYIENLTLTGSADINGVGNSLANILIGNGGKNVLTGGKGNDTYFVQTEGDKVVEKNKQGDDHVFSTVNFSLAGQYIEKLTLEGTAKYGVGNSLNNVITGNASNNVLSGGGGHDRIVGGKGADALTGGAGADRFLFTWIDDSTAAASDRITDLAAEDKIDLTGIDANATIDGNQGFRLVDSFTGAAGEARWTYDAAAGMTYLWLNTDTDLEAEGLIRINGDHRDFENLFL